MAVVTLDQAQVGMVLASDVRDRRGRLLMPAGRELTAKHVEAFRMWGVVSVEIEGGPEKEPPRRVFDDATLERADWETDLLFANASDAHPFLTELRAIARLRVAEAISQEKWSL
jgi:hypothetical protein